MQKIFLNIYLCENSIYFFLRGRQNRQTRNSKTFLQLTNLFLQKEFMQIVIKADGSVLQEFMLKAEGTDVEIKLFEGENEHGSADAFFLLSDNDLRHSSMFMNKPVFINAVADTIKDLELPSNFCRINAWPGFLNRPLWEVATTGPEPIKILDSIGWKYIKVEDEPGLVAARVIAMIINEAYFALGEGVSSKNEIDLAMKLGTNYPFGPFEWSQKIGLEKIYSLLQKLKTSGTRYTIAPALEKEIHH
jgi:3-hydroxybutyryl-CoA dehydrogenase